jgi:hypothetical protein
LKRKEKSKEHEVSFDRVLHHGKAVPRMRRTTFHKLTGHSGDEYISPTDECFGVDLIGTKKKCVNCAMKKTAAKQHSQENGNMIMKQREEKTTKQI